MAALDYYDKAISLARENGYIQEEALSNELAARFCLGKGKKEFARIYMKEVHRCYESWGAVRKVKDLKKRYPHLLEVEAKKEMIGTTAGAVLEILDLSTLMKATNAISSEIEIDKLLNEIMLIVIENASAQCGFLLLEKDGVWQIVAKGGVGAEAVKTALPVSIDKSDLVSTSVVRFVARTKENIVLDDASRQGEFISDPHIKLQRTKSLLCIPLLSRSKLIGILYLENNLTTHAFTQERVQLLEMLLSQAAISLDNARAYEALRESEQKFQAIFNQAFQFIGVLSIDGIILQANQTGLRFAGISADDVLGKPVWKTPWWNHSIHLEQRLQAAIREAVGGKLVRFGAKHFAQNGEVHFADVSLKPITDEQGQVVQLIIEGRDITERILAEEEIRKLNQELEQRVIERTAKLETANEELEAFAYSVSHDLRAPLRHIDGFLGLLQKKMGAGPDEQSRHYMVSISEAAQKMGLLIDDLLSFSRMSRHALSFRPVELGPLVRKVIRELGPDAAGRNIAWRIGDLPAVSGDAAMLRIVLTNLIANAVKFTRSRQEARIEIGLQPGQDTETVIFVRDNGVGFDMAYADRLFGVFQRLHHTDEFEGTGIGLATVRRIVARHGGRTWAEGKAGQGSTFFFSLPKPVQEV
jgi:PAS domain S-box-containing protein